jgi:type IV pilus assembly protein PilV
MRHEAGSTLIEVLVSILVLSFGVLTACAVLGYAVQMPKLSGYRATAVEIASTHIDKIRANLVGFQSGDYEKPLSYDATFNDVPRAPCAYPSCTASSLANMDSAETASVARKELPAGGVLVKCDPGPCGAASFGNVWVIWQEPTMRAALDPATSDNCPVEVTSKFDNPRPRCVYMRFKP